VDGRKESLQAVRKQSGHRRIATVEYATSQVELWRQAQKVRGLRWCMGVRG
jgi:hypothetical protein